MKTELSTIDPTANQLPDIAVIQKVNSPQEQLPNEKHEKAVHAFLIADAIASGISNDLSFVDKIPQFINEIIDNKSWECLYVSKAVAKPYYCCYDKGSDSENFRAFITAKRPNGLGTSVETLDRVLQAELDIQRKFRAIIYESRQGERTDLDDTTSTGDQSKLSRQQQTTIRAANRAAEAIPEIGELLDRGLIAIDVAAKLGRQIKDPDNLTAEEREYIDKRDLVGLRIKEYINTNTIPEDEDKEPAYSRKLNEFVKDLLGIKNRSKTVRMDNPKKAAEKLLKFYEGKKLQELLKYLQEGLKLTTSSTPVGSSQDIAKEENSEPTSSLTLTETSENGTQEKNPQKLTVKNLNSNDSTDSDNTVKDNEKKNHQKQQITSDLKGSKATSHAPEVAPETVVHSAIQKKGQAISNLENIKNTQLTRTQLGKRLGLNPNSISNFLYKQPDQFSQWTKKKDPDGLAWRRTEKKGRSYFFTPV